MATFSQDVRNLTALTCYDMDLHLEQGIESAEDLAMFGEKDIDQLFQTPDLKATPLMKQLKLKALAEWLRDRSYELLRRTLTIKFLWSAKNDSDDQR
jgi:hypothetical protein